jgi:hypothetical protein
VKPRFGQGLANIKTKCRAASGVGKCGPEDAPVVSSPEPDEIDCVAVASNRCHYYLQVCLHHILQKRCACPRDIAAHIALVSRLLHLLLPTQKRSQNLRYGHSALLLVPVILQDCCENTGYCKRGAVHGMREL